MIPVTYNSGSRYNEGVCYNGSYPELGYVVIEPVSSSITIAQSQTFTAQVYDIFDQPVFYNLDYVWTATGGSITDDGVFTSTEAGDFLVTVTVYRTYETVSATAQIKVESTTKLIKPNGGEYYESGSIVPIEWTVPSVIGASYVNLYLSRDNGLTYDEIIAFNLSPTETNYNWIAPSEYIAEAKIKVVVYSSLGEVIDEDESDGSFVIQVSLTGSIIINGGAKYTESLIVSLDLTVNGVAPFQMRINNYYDMYNVEWEPFSSTKMWSLLSGVGIKTVYVQFKDALNRVSKVYMDTIAYVVYEKYFGLEGYGAVFRRENKSSIEYPAIDNFPLDQGTIQCWVGTYWNANDKLIHYIFDHAPRKNKMVNRVALYKNTEGYMCFEIRDYRGKLYRTMADIKNTPRIERHTLEVGQKEVKLEGIPAFSSLDLNQDKSRDLFMSYDNYFIIYLIGSSPLRFIKARDYDPATKILTIDTVEVAGEYEFNYIANWTAQETVAHFVAVSYKLRPKYILDKGSGTIIYDPNENVEVFYRLYIDGQRRTTGTLLAKDILGSSEDGYFPPVIKPITVMPQVFHIGSDVTCENQWDGIIKEFRILNKASTDEDIMEDYQLGRNGYEFIINETQLESRRNMKNNTLMLMHYDRSVFSEPSVGSLAE